MDDDSGILYPPGSTAWLVPELTTLPLSSRRCLVRSLLDGASLELSSGEQAVLAACAGCLPIAEHTERAAARLRAPAEHQGAIRELLERCARAGLLVSTANLVARFGAPSGASAVPLGAVVIRTADRPRLLARLLASAEALEARSGLRQPWIVVDDSHDPAQEHENRVAIAQARKLQITHHDRAAGDALHDALLAQFPLAAREIEWLLAPASAGEATPGRPLNHALLLTAGRAFVHFDDDAVIDTREPPLADPGTEVTDGVDELTWYDSEQSLLQHCPPADVDPIAEHAQWLGLPLADAWLRARARYGALARMDIGAAQAHRFGADARIVLTHSHACGDPGSNLLPLQHFVLPERSRQWLTANPAVAGKALAGRVNWRGHARLRFAPRWQFTLTTIAGLDNSRLLPATTWGHRSQDLLLGALAHWIYPRGWQIDLPFALLHRRELARRWLRPGDAVAPDPLGFIIGYLERHESRRADGPPERRLGAAASLLADLAAASEGELSESLLAHEIEVTSQLRFAIQTQLDDPTLPAAWKDLLTPWLAASALSFAPAALAARVPARAAMRSLLERYAAALDVWPQLWEFCRERQR